MRSARRALINRQPRIGDVQVGGEERSFLFFIALLAIVAIVAGRR